MYRVCTLSHIFLYQKLLNFLWSSSPNLSSLVKSYHLYCKNSESYPQYPLHIINNRSLGREPFILIIIWSHLEWPLLGGIYRGNSDLKKKSVYLSELPSRSVLSLGSTQPNVSSRPPTNRNYLLHSQIRSKWSHAHLIWPQRFIQYP